MKLKGKLKRDGHWWLVECPALGMFTQGKTRKDALEMAADWVKTALERPDFQVQAALDGDGFTLSSADPAALLALVVSRKREAANITYRELATSLGLASTSSLREAMLAKHDLGVGRLQMILEALGCEMVIDIVQSKPAAPARARVRNAG